MVKSRYRKSVPTPLLHYFLLTILFFRFRFAATAKKPHPVMETNILGGIIVKKINSVFIDLRNAEQVNWWLTKTRSKVKVRDFTNIVDTATGNKIGVVMRLGGFGIKKIIKENNKFLGENLKVVRFR